MNQQDTQDTLLPPREGLLKALESSDDDALFLMAVEGRLSRYYGSMGFYLLLGLSLDDLAKDEALSPKQVQALVPFEGVLKQTLNDKGVFTPLIVFDDSDLAQCAKELQAWMEGVLAACERLFPAHCPSMLSGEPLQELRTLLDSLTQTEPITQDDEGLESYTYLEQFAQTLVETLYLDLMRQKRSAGASLSGPAEGPSTRPDEQTDGS